MRGEMDGMGERRHKNDEKVLQQNPSSRITKKTKNRTYTRSNPTTSLDNENHQKKQEPIHRTKNVRDHHRTTTKSGVFGMNFSLCVCKFDIKRLFNDLKTSSLLPSFTTYYLLTYYYLLLLLPTGNTNYIRSHQRCIKGASILATIFDGDGFYA